MEGEKREEQKDHGDELLSLELQDKEQRTTGRRDEDVEVARSTTSPPPPSSVGP